jgi:hypothetical protein
MAGTPRLISIQDRDDKRSSVIAATYLVKLDTLSEGTYGAKMAVIGQGAPAGYYIASVAANRERRKGPLWVEVEATYEKPLDGSENPLDRPAIMSTMHEEERKSYYKDAAGLLVLNTAMQRFEAFPLKRDGKLIIRLVKNLPTAPVVAFDMIKYTRNSDPVVIKGTTYDVNTLLLLPVTQQEVRERVGDVVYHYFSTTFLLLADHGLHLDLIEDRGYTQLVSGKPVQILNTDMSIPTTPWPLDGEGGAMPNPGDEPAELVFIPYGSIAWGLDSYFE